MNVLDRAHQALIRAEMAGERVRWSWQERRSYWAVRRSQRRVWAGVQTFPGLCDLMADFCSGAMLEWPGHGGPRDPETVEIGAALVNANRNGFMTVQSQPGRLADPDMDVAWIQRPAVQGYCSMITLNKLAAVVEGTRLVMTIGCADNVRRIDRSGEVVVSRIDDEDWLWFGAILPRREIEAVWSGAVADHLVEEIVGMCQVLIYDPLWGDLRLLWDRLEAM